MIENFKFFCQKILPLVYDDSLSYYEVLCKVSYKLNEVIDQLNGVVAETGAINADSKNTLAETKRAVADVESKLASLKLEMQQTLANLPTYVDQSVENKFADGEFDNLIVGRVEDAVNTKQYSSNNNAPIDFAFNYYGDDNTSTNYNDWDWTVTHNGKTATVGGDVYVCAESFSIDGNHTLQSLHLAALENTKYALVEIVFSDSNHAMQIRVPYNCVSNTGVFPIPPLNMEYSPYELMLHFVKVY